MKIHIPSFKAMAKCNSHLDHAAFDLEISDETLSAAGYEKVVRCDECVCCSRWDDQLVCSRISESMDGYYHGTVDVVKPDDYCSYGIRKTAKPIDSNKGLE